MNSQQEASRGWQHVVSQLEHNRAFKQLADWLSSDDVGGDSLFCSGLNEGAQQILLKYIYSKIDAQPQKTALLYLAQDSVTARDLSAHLTNLNVAHLFLPDWGEGMLYNNWQQIAQERSIALHRLACASPSHMLPLVTSMVNTLLPIPSAAYMRRHCFSLTRGSAIALSTLMQKLISMGYIRVPRSAIVGEFSVKGECIDIFPVGSPYPLRINLNFDTIESIREFDPIEQVPIAERPPLTHILIVPMNEFPIQDDAAERDVTDDAHPDIPQSVAHLLTYHRTCKQMETLFDLRSSPVLGIYYRCNPAQSQQIADTYSQSVYKNIQKNHSQSIYHRIQIGNHPRTAAQKIILQTPQDDAAEVIPFQIGRMHRFYHNTALAKKEMEHLLSRNYTIYTERSIFPLFSALSKKHTRALFAIDIVLENGILLSDEKMLIVSERDIFVRGKRARSQSAPLPHRSSPLSSLSQLKRGDYVTHITYGIGRYLGIERLFLNNKERDYCLLEYADENRIYVPTNQFNLMSAYISKSDYEPQLDNIGGHAWSKRKIAARERADQYAIKLLRLYALREQQTGIAFKRDNEWQTTLSHTFPYQETDAQIRAIKEIFHDMEQGLPMNRLLCGDSAVGKTEIAIRAASKAVFSHYQVVILVPTTVLAEQHYTVFCDRLQQLPIEIRLLSRFTRKQDVATIVTAIAHGVVDIIIGTHKILHDEIRYKNIGLLIVDEEHKFGVADKEKIKALRTNIDLLSMSATPIPRSLHMALGQISNMSLLDQAPTQRKPILSKVLPYTSNAIKAAISNELRRTGQVYYLHNRIKTLAFKQRELEDLIPNIRCCVIHSKLSAAEIDTRLYQFIHRQFDILLSTTIIENGIDIPNVNTIIIDRADLLGVSSLYQLRGRVGRSDRQAFAFLLYRASQKPTEHIMRRLMMISENSDIGSGFAVAVHDLSVRGAGNILGKEQSGDLYALGFDLYVKILNQAIHALQENDADEFESYLDLEYHGYIPADYMKADAERLNLYQQLATTTNERHLTAVEQQTVAMYGAIPQAAQELFTVARLRIVAQQMRIISIQERSNRFRVRCDKMALFNQNSLLYYIESSIITLTDNKAFQFIIALSAAEESQKYRMLIEIFNRLMLDHA